VLAEHVPVFALLLIACIPLEIASYFAGILHRKFSVQNAQAEKPLMGNAFSGIKAVFASPYLLGIAAFISLMTLASTVLYFAQSDLVYAAITDRGERRALLASIDLWVNVFTIAFQVYITAYLIRWIGVGMTLALIPLAAAIGFIALGLFPTLMVLIVVQVVYRTGRYGITKGAREVLFTVVNREEKYKSKAFLDGGVYRGGDLVSGWMYAGLTALGFSIGAIALMAAPLAVLWAINGLNLGRRCEEKTPATVSNTAKDSNTLAAESITSAH